MTRPRLLDLFAGAGGAAMGYHLAGFDVVCGVDRRHQPNYPFDAIWGDAFDFLDQWHGSPFDVIHASPPCQAYSTTASLHTKEYPKLIGEVRTHLQATGAYYVIENVEGARADMDNPIRLCGSSFGLGVRRHRLFETSWPIGFVPQCAHYLQPEPIDVTGTGASRLGPRMDRKGGNSRKPRNLAHARAVMGIDWMTRPELSEAIPPAYTRFVGEQLLAYAAGDVA